MKVLIIDNYDSFVYNLKQGLGDLGASCTVKRNDAITIKEVRTMDPDAVVLSPGPGHPSNPRDFGICDQVLEEVSSEVPTLGVCLGHQGIASHFGAEVIRAPLPVHGKVSMIEHDGQGIYAGLPNPLPVGRYHSLIVSGVPPSLTVTATSNGLIMGVRHVSQPIEGVQFHPESVLTPHGQAMLSNFMNSIR